MAVVTNEDLAEKVQGLGALRRFVGDVAPERSRLSDRASGGAPTEAVNPSIGILKLKSKPISSSMPA